MLVRDNKGNLIEVIRYDFSNDQQYYQYILKIKSEQLNAYDLLQTASK